jgi:hypothetical protein
MVNKEIQDLAAHYNLGAWDSLASMVDKLRQMWGSDFLPPPRKRGESEKDYKKKYDKVARDHYALVVRKLGGMVSSGTISEPAILRGEGKALADGSKIILPERPLANNRRDDWTLPVAAFHAS